MNTLESITESHHRASRRDSGFTLIEVLIAIVVVGVLSAVVILGIGALTDSGEESACTASADAAKAAATVFYANEGRYPLTLSELTAADPPVLEMPTDVTVASGANVTSGTGASWTLTMTPGSGTDAPTFAC